jgi:hypothetical protein
LFAKYNWNYQVKEDEMSRACSTNGGEEECIQEFGGKAGRKRPLEIWLRIGTNGGPL